MTEPKPDRSPLVFDGERPPNAFIVNVVGLDAAGRIEPLGRIAAGLEHPRCTASADDGAVDREMEGYGLHARIYLLDGKP